MPFIKGLLKMFFCATCVTQGSFWVGCYHEHNSGDISQTLSAGADKNKTVLILYAGTAVLWTKGERHLEGSSV